MKFLLLPIVLAALTACLFAQEGKRLKTFSKKYDLVVSGANCSEDWRGGMCDDTIKFYRKAARKHFQTISLRGGDQPPIFGDFNFDGHEDVAICDGKNGGYMSDSYRVYLYSPTRGKFVFSPSYTKLSQGPELGFFEIDKKNKTLTTGSKMGYGYFEERKYDVFRGKPRLIYKITHDESSAEGIWATITTKKLIAGKWRTWSKRKRIEPIPSR